MPFRHHVLNFLLLTILVSLVALLVDRGKIMTPEITTPYFSAAALPVTGQGWEFNVNEAAALKKVNEIANADERRKAINNFRFSDQREQVRTYSLNQPGLVWCIKVARMLFGFAGDILALKLLQLLIHILASFFILKKLNTGKKRLLFLFLYVLNPFIIYLTIFPFYYFWQVIPSFLIIILMQNDRMQKVSVIIFFAILFAAVCQIRITVLPVTLLILLFGFSKLNWKVRIMALGVFALAFYLLSPSYTSKHPGHVMYASLGAYPGSPVRSFSDTTAFQDYSKATGINYSYQTTPGMYDAEVIMGEAKWGYEQFVKFAKDHPFIILRNAALNFFEGFSAGYITKSLSLTYLSAFIGCCFFYYLIRRKQWKSIVLIITSFSAYFLYLAPVPIYLYGTYVLLVFGLLSCLDA
ncbi:MAG: hypothetical protein U0X76_03090 [Bacteroidia bacterium]